MIPMNSDYYDKVTNENIEWLKKELPDRTHERDAIIDRMQIAKKYYREVHLPNLPESSWQG